MPTALPPMGTMGSRTVRTYRSHRVSAGAARSGAALAGSACVQNGRTRRPRPRPERRLACRACENGAAPGAPSLAESFTFTRAALEPAPGLQATPPLKVAAEVGMALSGARDLVVALGDIAPGGCRAWHGCYWPR